jgi:UDP-N-acetylmuramate dehydrogenase
MLIEAGDENRRSVGSFFLNPIVSAAQADEVAMRARASGLLAAREEMPRYPQADGSLKLSAAWLIEKSGTRKGERFGGVGISTRHSLALVHHGGASTGELLALAETVRARVRSAFQIELAPEPVPLGFDRAPF